MRRGRLSAAAVAGALLVPAVAHAPRDDPAVLEVGVARAAGVADVASGVTAGRGRVLTVAHVLERGGAVSVRGTDGRRRAARVLASDPALDLALLAVPGLPGPSVEVGTDTTRPRLVVRREGRLEAHAIRVRRPVEAHLVDLPGRPRRAALELAADVAVGDSGAPVVNEDGELVGVVYARSRTRAGTAYAVAGGAIAAWLARTGER